MYRISLQFHNRLTRGEVPIPYLMIQTHMGWHVYSEKEPAGVFGASGNILDGSFLLDGSVTLGAQSIAVIAKGARVLNLSPFESTLQPIKDDVLTALSSKQRQHLSIEMDNADEYFSRIIPAEPFLGRPIYRYVGFEDDPQSEHLSRFRGIITEISLMPVMTIEADER